MTADRAPFWRDKGWRGLARAAASLLFGLFPLLAACRPTVGDLSVSGGEGVSPDDPDAGCIELTGEVALPDPAASHQIDVPEAVLGRIAAPVTPAPGGAPDAKR